MRHSFRCRRRFSDWYFRFRVFLTYDFATRELLVGRAVRRGRAVRGLWLGDGHPLGGMDRTPLMITASIPHHRPSAFRTLRTMPAESVGLALPAAGRFR